jgi:dihydrofolate synthase/folylpolyglutamate synthase
VAIAAVRELHGQGWSMTDDAISDGLANVRIPARIEVLRDHPVVLVDAAHNVASAKALADVLTSLAVSGRRWLILAATLGKDVPGIVRELLPRFDRVVITQYENNPRAMPTEELAGHVAAAGEEMEWAACPTMDIARTPTEAWRHVEASAGQDDLVCATGSFFIASEIRRLVVGTP